MGGEWQEGFLDIRLDGTVDLSSEPLMVPPDRLLRARNVVHDKPGTARMRPPRVEGATIGSFAHYWDTGNQKVYSVGARGSEQLALTKDGIIRHREANGTWAADPIYGRESGYETRIPDAVHSAHISGQSYSTSVADDHQQVASLEHYRRWIAYLDSNDVLGLHVEQIDGREPIEDVIIAQNVYRFELLRAGNEVGFGGRVRIIWMDGSSSSLKTCIVSASESDVKVYATQSLPLTITIAGSEHFAAESHDAAGAFAMGFSIIYVSAGSGNWRVLSYDAPDETTLTSVATLDTGHNPNINADQPDIDTIGDGRTAACYTTNAGEVAVSVFDQRSLTNAITSVVFTSSPAPNICMVTAAGSGRSTDAGRIFAAASHTGVGSEYIEAQILDDASGLPSVWTSVNPSMVGYVPAARPGTIDNFPVIPVLHVRNQEFYGRGFELVTPADGGNTMYPLARVGLENSITSGRYNIRSKIRFTYYRKTFAYYSTAYGWPQNVRTVTFENTQSARWVEANGISYIPGSTPTVYDGSTHREATWLQAPYITSVASGGFGDQIGNTDTYSVKAVWVWVDSQGRAHRSPPSAAYSWTPSSATDKPLVSVIYPMHTTQHGGYTDPAVANADPYGVGIEIYMQRVGTDSVHKLVDISAGGGSGLSGVMLPSSFSGGIASYNQTSYDSAGATLYTDNGELEASPLPAVAQFELIGDRLWALDAEERNRVWPSKTLADGYAFEWNAALVQRVPGTDIEAISQVANGRALCLRKDGLYIFYGDGPTNGGVGGDFGVPRLVDGAPGCFNGKTVVRVPAGVMYQSDSGFHILRNDLSVVDVSPLLDLHVQDQDFIAATYSDRDKRVVFWQDGSSGAENLCYDVRQGKWSTWLTSRETVAAAQLRNGTVLTADLDGTDYDLSTFATGTDSSEASLDLVWRSAWLQPAGIHGRVKWCSVILTMRKISDHAVTLKSYTHGDDSAAVATKSWTSAEVDGELQGDIYTLEATTLWPGNGDANARAVMLEVTVSRSSTGMAAYPLSMRVMYKTDADRRRQQLGSGGRK